MDVNEHQQYLEILQNTPEKLRAALNGVSKKLLLWTPSPGKWSIQEIICHMRDMERDAYLARYQRILNEANPLLKNIDGDAYVIERQYRRMKLSEVIRDFRNLRKETLKLLKKVRDDQWLRPGIHETDGPLTVELLLKRQAIGNDEAHLGQIEHIKMRYEILQKYENGLKLIESAARGIPEEILRRRPAPDKWSIMEIVAHLAITEQIILGRYAMIASAEKPVLSVFDNDELASSLKFNEQDLDQTLKELKRLRTDTLNLLRALPQKSWQRIGIHPQRGELSIEAIAKTLSNHDFNHASQIRALREKFGVMSSDS